MKVGAPLLIIVPPVITVIENEAYGAPGIVEKVNVAPPLLADGEITGLLDENTAKSEAIPVVGPNGELLETEIVHVMGFEARIGLPAEHESNDCEVGTP